MASGLHAVSEAKSASNQSERQIQRQEAQREQELASPWQDIRTRELSVQVPIFQFCAAIEIRDTQERVNDT